MESIDKSSKGYKLELTNDNKLYFDTKGKFLRKKK
ncbi:PepSY-like domain-containing protein [Sphingobacterium paramultivorum]